MNNQTGKKSSKQEEQMRTMSYVLQGDPTPLARVRVNYNTRRMYDSQQQVKLIIGITLRQQHDDKPLLEGPICLEVTFFMPFPCGMSISKKASNKGKSHHSRPDLDNLIKLILDCSNKICYEDDASIAIIHAKKIYDANPRTEFTLSELK